MNSDTVRGGKLFVVACITFGTRIRPAIGSLPTGWSSFSVSRGTSADAGRRAPPAARQRAIAA
jgi:hypothetical protein